MKQDIQWDAFNPDVYIKNNYDYIHDEDKIIIDSVCSYLSKLNRQFSKAIDVGAGPNLYPSFMLMPYTEKITLMEYSQSNISYLNDQKIKLDDKWSAFGDYLTKLDQYKGINFTNEFNSKIKIEQGDIFELSKPMYDIGTMFFCAESITNKLSEFIKACKCFVQSIKPGGVIIAAFMEGSEGYTIASEEFPAIKITQDDVAKCFDPLVKEKKIMRIPAAYNKLRPGYSGMILLTAVKAL